jgi:LDH2 family malate/lactate/ureidoglycolate dehydrogenase
MAEMIYRTEGELYALVRRVLLAAGADQDNAGSVAAHLARANLSGVDSHGVWHLRGYVEQIQAGAILPAEHPAILQETPGSALISGNWSFGHPVGAYAMELAIAKAAAHGMAIASVVRKHHLGRLGHYVEMAAERGMIGIALAGGQGVAAPAAVPYGGAENLLHTNPLAVAFPTGVADHPLMFDFATSATSGVKVTNAQRRGEKVAHGYIVDRHGSPTDDPRDFFAGGGHAPFGGHKGYAIMLMVEYLGRIFSGADSFADERRGGIVRHEGGTMIAIKADLFQPLDRFEGRSTEFAQRTRAVPPAPGFAEVLVPGDPEARTRAVRRRDGIPIEDDVWQTVVEAGALVGVTVN